MEFSYRLLGVFSIIPFIIFGFSIYFVEIAYQNIEYSEINEFENLMNVQKQKVISDFNYLSDAIEAYPKLSEWEQLSSVENIKDELGGIPEFDETEKRKAAKFLISDFGFQSFGITLIDGSMYFLEPYEHQSNLSKVNFSDREWFQGVLSTETTYVSDVFISAASGNPIIVISTPVFSYDGEVIGMWGGSLDLEYLTSFFEEVKKEKSSILLIDQNNIVIANTDDPKYHEIIKDKSIVELLSKYENGFTSFKNNDEFVFIDNIEIGNKNWKMITKISDENFVPHVTSGINNNYALIGLMIVFIIASEYLLFRFLKKNFQLNLNIKENRRMIIKQERLAAIGELASRIAHDIRNPLSNIRISLQLIVQQSPDTKISDDIVDEKMLAAFKNIDRISHQVNNVLDYVRERKVLREKISLGSCLEETLQSLHIPKNIKIKSNDTNLKILADPIQLQIVCNNIILNAIQAIGKDTGEITIKFSEDDYYVLIEIGNSGPNIPEEILPHIFESLITTKEIGTGLGLSSCKRIIESHGGKITVKNNPPAFTIKLPKS